LGSAYATQQNHPHFVRFVVGVLVSLLLFTGFVSECEAYPAMVCCRNQAGTGHTNQHHQDTHAAAGHEQHATPHGDNAHIDVKSDSPSCCDALGCEGCRSYFTGHLNGLISVMTETEHLQCHPTFAPPPSRLSNVTAIPEPPPPKHSHA